MAPEESSATTISVLGFHRSGTSLTARVLNLLGVDLGAQDDLLAAGEVDNPRGYWEPRWMNEINDELLATLGSSWWKPFPATPGWERDPRLDALRERAAATLEQKLGDVQLRGWKDPRTTLTLPFWRQLVPEQRYVVCVRNPIDAVASLQRRPEPTLPVLEWGELWLEYLARALVETTGRPRMVVFYDDFFSAEAERLVERLAEFAGVPLRPDDERRAPALAVAEGNLRRHATSARELAADPGVPAAARTAYLALRAVTAPGGDDDACAADERLDRAIERVVPDLWWSLRSARDAARTAEAETAATALEGERALERASELADELRAEIDGRGTALAAGVERERHLNALLEQRERELAATRSQLATVHRSLSWRLTAPLRNAKSALRARR